MYVSAYLHVCIHTIKLNKPQKIIITTKTAIMFATVLLSIKIRKLVYDKDGTSHKGIKIELFKNGVTTKR